MNIIISNSANEPIYEQIYRQLKNSIICKELAENEMLPSIRALAKDLRISVITTKRAYDELEKDGFINTVAGKGCFVAKQDSELVREQHLRELERLIEQMNRTAMLCGLTKDELLEIIGQNYQDFIEGGEKMD